MSNMTTLRDDARGWEIEAEGAAEGTLMALEIAGLIMLEMFLHRIAPLHRGNQDVEMALKGLGTLSGRVGMTRLAHLTGIDQQGMLRDRDPDRDHQVAGEMMKEILDWLLVWEHDPDAPPSPRQPSKPESRIQKYLSELHAAAIYLDRRAMQQGSRGPGKIRSMIRSSTRGGN